MKKVPFLASYQILALALLVTLFLNAAELCHCGHSHPGIKCPYASTSNKENATAGDKKNQSLEVSVAEVVEAFVKSLNDEEQRQKEAAERILADDANSKISPPRPETTPMPSAPVAITVPSGDDSKVWLNPATKQFEPKPSDGNQSAQGNNDSSSAANTEMWFNPVTKKFERVLIEAPGANVPADNSNSAKPVKVPKYETWFNPVTKKFEQVLVE